MIIYEQTLIGGLLHDTLALRAIRDWLLPKDFTDSFLKSLYTAMLQLDEAGDPVDINTLTQTVQPLFPLVNVFSEIVHMLKNLSMKVDVMYYGRKILEASKRADLKNLVQMISNQLDDNKPFPEIIESIYSGLQPIYQGSSFQEGFELHELMLKISQERDDQLNGLSSLKIMTHIPSLDKILGGLYPGQLITIAADSGGGKSTFGLNLIKNIATKQKIPVMLLTLEMTPLEVGISALASICGTPMDKLKSTDEVDCELTIKLATRAREDLINDGINFKVWCGEFTKFSAAIRLIREHLKNQPNCRVVMIDYIGLMVADNRQNKNSTKVHEIEHMTRTLKNLAMELDIVILILAQTNRNNDQQISKPLRLNDIRDSSSLAHDANIVIFIQPDQNESNVKLIVAKNRNGSTGVTIIGFNKSRATFYEIN